MEGIGSLGEQINGGRHVTEVKDLQELLIGIIKSASMDRKWIVIRQRRDFVVGCPDAHRVYVQVGRTFYSKLLTGSAKFGGYAVVL